METSRKKVSGLYDSSEVRRREGRESAGSRLDAEER